MKRFYYVKLVIMIFIICLVFSAGVFADSVRKKIEAIEAKDMYLKYNGEEFIARDGNNKIVYPIVVEGTSYLPVRAVCDIAGLKVDWDGDTRTILLTSSDYINVDDDGYVQELEINDTKADANIIEDISKGKVKGRVGEALTSGKDKKDLWKFEVKETGVVSITVAGNKGAEADVTIRDDSNDYDVIHFETCADANGKYIAKLTLTAGIYYIELDGSSEEMPYKIDTTFRATPDDFEDDDSESNAKTDKFNGTKYINSGAFGAGNDQYYDYIIIDDFNSMTYDISFDWKGTRHGGYQINMYDANGDYVYDEWVENPSIKSSESMVNEHRNATVDKEIKKIVICLHVGEITNICTEYTLTVQK